jgi:hypothetical protein
MVKIKEVLTFGTCVLTLSLTHVPAFSAETEGMSADKVVYTKPAKSCTGCTKLKLKSGMWQIGVFR